MLYQDRMKVRRLKYLSRPPWRSYHFLFTTFFLLMVTLTPIQIIVHFRLPLDISKIWPMYTPVVCLVVFWVRVWKAHSDVYQAIHFTSVEERAKDARIAVPLDALAYMLYGGFGLALFAVILSYGVMAHFIRASLHR